MKLYGYRNGRTLRALWTLEEIGAPYEFIEVDLKRGEHCQPDFLALNPAGKVPVLDDGGTIVTESAAICMHLAERNPDSGLLPPTGTAQRTECYKWISFILTELDAPLWTIAKHRFALPHERRVPAVIETAHWEFRKAVSILEAVLAHRHYFAGDAFSVVDILAGHTLLWAKSGRVRIEADSLHQYLARLMARAGAIRAHAAMRPTATAATVPQKR